MIKISERCVQFLMSYNHGYIISTLFPVQVRFTSNIKFKKSGTLWNQRSILKQLSLRRGVLEHLINNPVVVHLQSSERHTDPKVSKTYIGETCKVSNLLNTEASV